MPILTDLTEFVCASRVAPAVWSALLLRKAQVFRVTAKGLLSDRIRINWPVFLQAGLLFVLTALAILALRGSLVEGRLADGGDPGLYTFWSCWNLLILALVMLLAVERPRLRREERFNVNEPACLHWQGRTWPGQVLDMSVSGARLHVEAAENLRDAELTVTIPGIGTVPAHVTDAGGHHAHLRFAATAPRAAIITKLYAGDYSSVAHQSTISAALGSVFKRAFGLTG